MDYIFSLTGTVLYDDPRTLLRTLWKDETRALRLYTLVFESPEWRMLTEGSVKREEALEWLCRRTPEEADHIRLALKYWPRCLTPRWETVALLLDMKSQNRGLYFYAETAADGKEHIHKTYPFMTLFEGGLFSCDGQAPPPYTELCRLYNLAPSHCFWVDTSRERVRAAETEGLRGVLFTNAERLRDSLI
ncbi:MAG: hypothetical protein LBR76_05460 [Oscillospiraceae bacterium]|jgi:putative hydrolase of the HAD superfamily|nr:hypothetical protein [Oscillospiraceae bacterium]